MRAPTPPIRSGRLPNRSTEETAKRVHTNFTTPRPTDTNDAADAELNPAFCTMSVA